MIHAAGILIIDKAGLALFLKRGPGGNHPNEWCFPGGRLEDGETVLAAAVRECEEESGYKADPKVLKEHARRIAINPMPPMAQTEASPPEEFDFTSFLLKGVETFIPALGPKGAPEHVGWAWAPPGAPPEPLHEGCRVALAKLTMNELDVARAIAAGDLTSPQVYENVMLVAIRITGVGAAYRHKHKEYVWRDPSLYLNDEFLARCNGLTVIMEHPDGAVLNSKEYANRAVGSVFVPYIKGDEVWAVCKIYDHAAAKMLLEQPMSTSPAVVWRDPENDNDKVRLENGETLLIEGAPSLLDHIAICYLGVWDKGGAPEGVQQDGVRLDAAPPAPRYDENLNIGKLDAAIARLRGIEIDGLSRRLTQR